MSVKLRKPVVDSISEGLSEVQEDLKERNRPSSYRYPQKGHRPADGNQPSIFDAIGKESAFASLSEDIRFEDAEGGFSYEDDSELLATEDAIHKIF